MGREAAEGLEPSPEVAGREEVREGEACRAVGPSGMPNAQPGMVIVVVALDGGVPDRAVHPRDLAAGSLTAPIGSPVAPGFCPQHHLTLSCRRTCNTASTLPQ